MVLIPINGPITGFILLTDSKAFQVSLFAAGVPEPIFDLNILLPILFYLLTHVANSVLRLNNLYIVIFDEHIIQLSPYICILSSCCTGISN